MPGIRIELLGYSDAIEVYDAEKREFSEFKTKAKALRHVNRLLVRDLAAYHKEHEAQQNQMLKVMQAAPTAQR